jgi:cell division protein ZapA (FtsZ GTPase activity inhibitor)
MRHVAIQIMGQTLTVASDADEAWVKALAESVDRKIREVLANGRTVVSTSAAIAVALNLADELEKLKQQHQKLMNRIEVLNRKIAGLVEAPE